MMNIENLDEIVVNSLPLPTWEKLGMNRAIIKDFRLTGHISYENCVPSDSDASVSSEVYSDKLSAGFEKMETGMGEAVGRLLDSGKIGAVDIVAEGNRHFTYNFTDGEALGERMCITVKAGKKAVVIMDFISGAVYSINGKLFQISDLIFIAAPGSVDVSGDYNDILAQTGYDVPLLNKSM